jgi:maltokinase
MRIGPHTWLVVADPGDGHGSLVVPVADGPSGPRRAEAGDGAFAAIAGAMRDGAAVAGFAGTSFGEPGPTEGAEEVPIDVDQSNESVVVGGRTVVKLFPRTSAGPQPGLDLPVHLAAVGFDAIPAPLGALRWAPGDGEPTLLATAATFLPDARDGWDWYLERLLARLDGETRDRDPLTPAPVLGAIVARMHAALATPSATIPDPLRPADPETAASWRERAVATAHEALDLTTGEEGERLAARFDAIVGELEVLGEASGIATTRVHGDLHVGQVLEWREGYAITDFDGNPVAPASERTGADTPMRDVASFLASLDHLGRVASTRRPGADEAIEAWIEASQAAFLDAYRATLADRGVSHLFEPTLLRPLAVAQECHEYVYAARFLPRWRYVPDLAIRALFPGE